MHVVMTAHQATADGGTMADRHRFEILSHRHGVVNPLYAISRPPDGLHPTSSGDGAWRRHQVGIRRRPISRPLGSLAMKSRA